MTIEFYHEGRFVLSVGPFHSVEVVGCELIADKSGIAYMDATTNCWFQVQDLAKAHPMTELHFTPQSTR